MPKIDWEKEYKQSVKEKANKVKSEIFYALDKIENGQSLTEMSNGLVNEFQLEDIYVKDMKA